MNVERDCRRCYFLVPAHRRARVLSGVLPDHFLDVEVRSFERVAVLIAVGRDHLAVLVPLDRHVRAAKVVRNAAHQPSVVTDRHVAAVCLDRRAQATCTRSTSPLRKQGVALTGRNTTGPPYSVTV